MKELYKVDIQEYRRQYNFKAKLSKEDPSIKEEEKERLYEVYQSNKPDDNT